ncbi:MAG: DUF2807 domain-containing protein, partial [Robiginitalea sp.]|uniref:GIN domain-containing protein n=1 Tax=Robiginitalea sp. TaxID=1902411 RepID=UPI003C78AA0B
MNRNQFILCMSFFGLFLNTVVAQDKTVNQTLSAFSEIKVFDGISVNLIPSQKNEAVIRGANVGDVAIAVAEGSLKIRMKVTKIFSGYRTFVDVYYKQPLTVIDVNEDARIIATETIKQEVLEVKAQEGGEIQVKADVTQFLV